MYPLVLQLKLIFRNQMQSKTIEKIRLAKWKHNFDQRLIKTKGLIAPHQIVIGALLYIPVNLSNPQRITTYEAFLNVIYSWGTN